MIKGFIFDLDGTVYENDKLITGAKDVFKKLERRKIPFAFVTNTTSKNRFQIHQKLKDLGIEIDIKKLITPSVAAINFLNQNKIENIAVIDSKNLKRDFSEFHFSKKPEYIILADDGTGLSYEQINYVFQAVQRGAKVITLQENKYYSKNNNLVVDLGFYKAGFEYITNQKIENFGKPSKKLFSFAKKLLQVDKFSELAICGDDIEFDILKAQKFGINGFLVKTGKYRNGVEDNFEEKPAHIISNLTEIIDFIEEE